jgi:hypothetical protein
MSRFSIYTLILVGLAATVVSVGSGHPRFAGAGEASDLWFGDLPDGAILSGPLSVDPAGQPVLTHRRRLPDRIPDPPAEPLVPATVCVAVE